MFLSLFFLPGQKLFLHIMGSPLSPCRMASSRSHPQCILFGSLSFPEVVCVDTRMSRHIVASHSCFVFAASEAVCLRQTRQLRFSFLFRLAGVSLFPQASTRRKVGCVSVFWHFSVIRSCLMVSIGGFDHIDQQTVVGSQACPGG